MSVKGRSLESELVRIQIIASAPITVGEPWGPCLLGPDLDGRWTVGEWDGESWCADTGFQISPRYYGELPSLLSGEGRQLNEPENIAD